MQAISQNDYYALFQTGLYIALEELRVTQAHLAEVCGISAGYLSKLKGWQVFKPGDTLVAKPHVTNTNFRNYAVPMLEFLQAEHGIGFAEGFFAHAGAHSQTANAGIILGWKQTAAQPPQYYHILLDGSRMLLERVGALSGNDYLAFEHLDTGVPFRVEDGLEYHFSVHVTPRYISVFVNNQLRYQVASPPDIEGMVGIRPWRAAVECRYFEVGELA